jgi:hypothetical protein
VASTKYFPKKGRRKKTKLEKDADNERVAEREKQMNGSTKNYV